MLQSRDVAFVTLQIGSNDSFRCFRFRARAFDQACVDELLPKISARLTTIVETLRDAAGPDVPIVGANYSDPLLALWTVPRVPHDVVVAIADVWATVNDTLEQTYAGSTCRSPTLEQEFSAATSTRSCTRAVGDVPINVARAWPVDLRLLRARSTSTSTRTRSGTRS